MLESQPATGFTLELHALHTPLHVSHPAPAGKQAVDYFHTQCPALEGLKEGGNEAEWIVDLTTQADRRGRAGDFAATYAKSKFKTAADREIEQQLAAHSDLGALPWRCCLRCLRQRSLLCSAEAVQSNRQLPSLCAATASCR